VPRKQSILGYLNVGKQSEIEKIVGGMARLPPLKTVRQA